MQSQIQSLNEKWDNLTDAYEILKNLRQNSIKEKNEFQDELDTCENAKITFKSQQADLESEKKELNNFLTSQKSVNENLRSQIRQLEMEKTQAYSFELELSQGLSVIGLTYCCV